MYRILIIEDDRGIAEAIKEQAEQWELQARVVQNFRGVMTEFAEYAPHLVLLDIGLPFFNGYHWCSEIRKVCCPLQDLASRNIKYLRKRTIGSGF